MFSQRYLSWAAEVIGVERILFSTDYPFVPVSQSGRRFLEETDLSDTDQEKIASSNSDRLCASIRR